MLAVWYKIDLRSACHDSFSIRANFLIYTLKAQACNGLEQSSVSDDETMIAGMHPSRVPSIVEEDSCDSAQHNFHRKTNSGFMGSYQQAKDRFV